MKKIITYSAISILTIYFLFSILEIYNISALYKDQIEMPAMTSHENVSSDFLFDLLQKAKKLTNWINFFQYSALTSVVVISILLRLVINTKRIARS